MAAGGATRALSRALNAHARDAGVDECGHARSDVLDVRGRMLDVLGVAR